MKKVLLARRVGSLALIVLSCLVISGELPGESMALVAMQGKGKVNQSTWFPASGSVERDLNGAFPWPSCLFRLKFEN